MLKLDGLVEKQAVVSMSMNKMNLHFTEEQEYIRKMVRDFAKNEIASIAAQIDVSDQFPLELIKKMGKLGLLGIPIPEEWGGVGADFISYIATIEEISKASAAVGVILAVHTSVGTLPILNFGTEEQKGKYVTKLAKGEMIGAFALTEPQAGSDAGRIKLIAIDKDDHYQLDGSKIFITNGGVADLYVTFAVTDPTKGTKGISAFIVEKDTPGFTIGKKEKKMGLHGSNTTMLHFDQAKVPKANQLGQVGEGFKIAMSNLDGGRIGIGAQALGIAQAALEASIQYAKERKQFGQPISTFQAIQWKLADMATQIEAARLLIYQAASVHQAKGNSTKLSSMAKMFASDVAMKVTTEAVQIMGGYGYMRDYPVERYFRDAKITQIYEGTNQIQRMVIANQLFK